MQTRMIFERKRREHTLLTSPGLPNMRS